jgi:hypothetical protein
MNHEQEKIEQIKSLDPSGPNISAQLGLCRFEQGEDATLRRAKEEKVAESFQVRQGRMDIDGFVPAESVDHDGEYIATRREGHVQLHCLAWRDHGQWRRLSDWSEHMPESLFPHAEIIFAPEPGRQLSHPGQRGN